jgi:hypothetical protein
MNYQGSDSEIVIGCQRFEPALLTVFVNPGENLDAKPCMYKSGSKKQMQIALEVHLGSMERDLWRD